MNGQNYGEWLDSSETAERTGEETNNAEVNADHYVYEEQMDEVLIHDKPVGGIVPAASPTEEPAASPEPPAEASIHAAPEAAKNGSSKALFNYDEAERFRTRWNEIQAKFVDDPHEAVKQADALVSEAIVEITQMLSGDHSALESHWNTDKEISTEELRMTIQGYRSFFNRLVTLKAD